MGNVVHMNPASPASLATGTPSHLREKRGAFVWRRRLILERDHAPGVTLRRWRFQRDQDAALHCRRGCVSFEREEPIAPEEKQEVDP